MAKSIHFLSTMLILLFPANHLPAQQLFPPKIYLREEAKGVIRISKPARALSFQVQNISDLDGDGCADILSRFYDGNAEQYGIHIVYGNSRSIGNSETEPHLLNESEFLFADHNLWFIRTGDIDGNGGKEILFTGYHKAKNENAGPSTIYIMPSVPRGGGERVYTTSEIEGFRKIYSVINDFNYYIISSPTWFADMDGDGKDDVIFLSRGPNPQPGNIRAYYFCSIIYGDPGLPREINMQSPNQLQHLRSAQVLSDTSYAYPTNMTIGDMDNDSRMDLLFQTGVHSQHTLRGFINDTLYYGRSYLVYGSLIQSPQYNQTLIDTQWRVPGIASLSTNPKEYVSSDGYRNTFHTVSLGDMNGDGFDEVVLSYYNLKENGVEYSKMYVLFGSNSFFGHEKIDAMTSGIMKIYGADQEGTHFVFSDADGDGFNECFIGCNENWFYMLKGGSSLPERVDLDMSSQDVTAFAGGNLIGTGDINGDGLDDIVAEDDNTIYAILGRSRMANPGESVILPLSTSAASRYAVSFSDGTAFRMQFTQGRPFGGEELSIRDFGGALPDSFAGVPAGDGAAAFYGINLRGMRTGFRARCSFGYGDSLLAARGIPETALAVSRWDEDRSLWSKIPSTIDTANNTVTFSTDHFSLFALADTADHVIAEVRDADNVPLTFILKQNYPNPFNPATIICYEIPKSTHVALRVYNILGQEIKTLMHTDAVPGAYEARWDGTNNAVMPVAAGVYIYRLETTDGFIASKKMILMK